MEVELKIEPGQQEPKVIVTAGSQTPELLKLIEDLKNYALAPIAVWNGEERKQLPQAEFLRFYTEDKGVMAQTVDKIYAVHMRLYELEEKLNQMQFVRISNSEIINLSCITAVDLSITGTICMTLDAQVKTYVSRRYVKRIKEILKIRKEHLL